MSKKNKKSSDSVGTGWVLIIIQLVAYFGKAQSESLGKFFRISNSGEFFEFIGFNLFGIFGLLILFKKYNKIKKEKEKSKIENDCIEKK